MKNFIGIDYRIGNIVEVSMFDSEDAYESEKDDYLDTKDCPNKEWHLAEIISIEPDNPDYTFGLDVEAQCNAYAEIWERLEPVILQQKHLIKLGFECNDYGCIKENIQVKCMNGFSNVYFRTKIDDENDIYTSYQFLKKIKYIHELQNIYYLLVGIDIEIAGLFNDR